MNDVLLNIFRIVVAVLLCLCEAIAVFILTIGMYNICNTNKPNKKYYLIKYRFIYEHEIMIKAKNSVEARIKFQKKYKNYDFVSIEEIKDE